MLPGDQTPGAGLIDFHTHLRGARSISHPQAPHLPWLHFAAEMLEPVLAQGVELFSQYGRHPYLTSLYPRFKQAGFNEILRQFSKYQTEQLLSSMEKAGVSTSVICSIEPFIDTLDLLYTVELNPGHFLLFCSVDPLSPVLMERLRLYASLKGIVGLKIHPPLAGPLPTSDRMFELVEFAAGCGWPVIIHTGTFPFPLLEGADRALDLEPLIRTFSTVPIVLAHVGWNQSADVLELGARYPNVFTDTSWQPIAIIREAISAFGATRVLFGSDFPLFSQVRAKEILRSALEPEEFRRVGYENARNLLRTSAGL
ncbi:MAG: amidohydrolase family protein [Candidatus Sericytochromatia bacterium]|nr:amidohydrolase family protein [Candidatus Sericytochromatia bacterium]